jgi:hypothetical protein
MGLIAHYPFTQDTIDIIRNKNTPVTGGTKINNGMLGTCMKIPYSIDTGIKYEEWGLFKTDCSFGGWLYFDETECKAHLSTIVTDTISTTPTGTLLGYNAYGGLALTWVSNKIDISLLATVRSDASYGITISEIIPYNKWVHVYVTYDKLNQTISVFLDGNLINSQKLTSIKPSTTNTRYISNFFINLPTVYAGNGPNAVLPIRMNDIRVYNHTLSQKEVRDLYRTKIAHYKFDNPYEESTQNVIINTDLDVGWSKTYCTGIIWNDIEPPKGISSPVVSFYRSSAAECYWYSYGDYAPQEPGKTYTCSLYVKTRDSNFRIKFYTADNSEVGRYNSEYINVPGDDEWHRIIWQPFLNPMDSQSKSLSFEFFFGNPNGESQRTWFCAPQLEAKDHVTPFVNGIRHAIITDSSDFHEDISETLSIFSPSIISSNTKVGSNAMRFMDTQGLVKVQPNILVYQTATLTTWVYPIARQIISDRDMILRYKGIYLTINKDGYLSAHAYGKVTPGYHDYTGQVIPLNQWSMLTLVWESDNLKFYINGELKHTVVNTGYFTNTGEIYIGGEQQGTSPSRHFNGVIDDVRIYANALSAQDVKEVYETRAFIDDKGSLFCEEIVENDDDNLVWNGRLEDKSIRGFQNSGHGIFAPITGTFIATDGVFGNGCIDFPGYGEVFDDTLIPINNDNGVYEFNMWLRSTTTELSLGYMCVACYDREMKPISVSMVSNVGNTRTTLAADLKDGDTTVQLTSGVNWNNLEPGVRRYDKKIGIFDRPEYRNYEVARIDDYYLKVEGNVITLLNPWSRGLIKAGTKVSNDYDGGTYIYPFSGSIPQQWTKYSFKFNPKIGNFWVGTKYVRVGIFAGYGPGYKPWRFGGMTFKNITFPQNMIMPFNSGGNVSDKGILDASEVIAGGMPIRYIRNWIAGNTTGPNNHWFGLRAYNETEEEILTGKVCTTNAATMRTVAVPFDPNILYGGMLALPCMNVRDGSLGYIDTTTNEHCYIQVDIGYIATITRINLNHYGHDTRSYYKNKLEVSTNGVDWITIFDSDIEGEYVEPPDGKDFYLNPKESIFTNDGYVYCKQIIEN